MSAREWQRDPYEWKTRSQWLDELHQLCTQLNAAGDAPAWTRRLLREYANEKFGVLLGTDVLTFDELLRLRDDLKHRLEALERNANASAEEAA